MVGRVAGDQEPGLSRDQDEHKYIILSSLASPPSLLVFTVLTLCEVLF